MDECVTARRVRAVCLAAACVAAPGATPGLRRRLARGRRVQTSAPAVTAPAAVPGFSFVKSAGRHRRISTRQQRPRRSARARSLRAGRDVPGDLSRRIAQRGDRHHGSDPYSRAPDVQGQRKLQRSQRQQRQAVPGARRRTVQREHLMSTAPTTSRPSAARTSRAMSRSKRTACAIFGCTKPTGRPR